MATAPKAKTAAPAEAEAPAKKSNKLLFIIAGVVLAVAAGGGTAWFMMHNGGGHQEAAKEVSKPPVFLPLEPFTVNLQGEGEDHYLQAAMTLKVANIEQVDFFKLNMPEVRSRMLLLLSSKHPDELSTPEEKQKLGDEIVVALGKNFSGQSEKPEISGVFFTSFVIQ